MNYKILLATLSISAFLVSCNKDKQINKEGVLNYVKAHAKYKTTEEIPAAKKIVIKWDFGKTDDSLAQTPFNSCVSYYLKTKIDYKKSGEGIVDETFYQSLSKDYYLNETAASAIADEDKLYLNKTGIKIDTKYEYQTFVAAYLTQWDNECKVLSTKSTITCDKYSFVRYFNLTY